MQRRHMQLLVTTKRTQGQRKNDFCWTGEDEIAIFGSQCDRGSVDDACGCRRAMAGLDSSKATTTVKVADLNMNQAELVDKYTEYLVTNWHVERDEASDLAKSEC